MRCCRAAHPPAPGADPQLPEDKSLVSLQLTGVAENENANGSFVLVDDLGRFEEGLFTGTKIDTDLSAYTPARLQSDVEKCQRICARGQSRA